MDMGYICNLVLDEQPYWWNMTVFEQFLDEAKIALEKFEAGAEEWVETYDEDPVAAFTNGKYTLVWFLAHLAVGHVSFCHHLASVVVVVINNFFKHLLL